VAYGRTVKTASGTTAVQIVWSSQVGSRSIEHIGSAHDDAELDELKARRGTHGHRDGRHRCREQEAAASDVAAAAGLPVISAPVAAITANAAVEKTPATVRAMAGRVLGLAIANGLGDRQSSR
jgi:hypothetical protein